MRRDLGDFQTPPGLVSAVLDRLDALGVGRSRVLEPTCGRGNFLRALLDRPDPPREAIGFEIQPAYCDEARAAAGVVVHQADVFATDFRNALAWTAPGPLLVVGNPPWVTSGELGRLESGNGPTRGRVEGLKGLDARTGRSNFDLAEAVWHKLLDEIDEPDATFALLCKTTTARNVVRWAVGTRRPIAAASIHRIDAKRWFGASVDACLLVVRFGDPATTLRVPVFPDLKSDAHEATIGVVDGVLIADLDAFDRSTFAFGRSPEEWRQGVKHDAAAVMELTVEGGALRNGLGEAVDVEPGHVFPLMKSHDLARRSESSRHVIITQTKLGDDTRAIEATAPRLWRYLTDHATILDARRSKVYDGRPPFSMFGIGDYAFAPHKVAVSGLHKAVHFRSIGPRDGRPVVFDDTCYFLPASDRAGAERLANLLESDEARGLLAALRFNDAKRPITKAILSRIDLGAIEARRALAAASRVEYNVSIPSSGHPHE